jgi:hypothetical protein
MNRRSIILTVTLALILLGTAGGCKGSAARANATPRSRAIPGAPNADNPDPPAAPVKLIFIHHSCGENWLADGDGGLGITLRDNNYFVSDTNYGWGPDGIGDSTDIGHWWTWFRGPNSSTYLGALYAESDQHADYSRLTTDPGGANEIVMFKSCFPNSHLGGSPDDVPTTGANPLRGQDAWSGDDVHNVANAKGIYNDILAYFGTRQDKLFVVVTAPPLVANDTDASHAANARAFNDWLVNDWLDGYPHPNVAVFDFYNVLTSNGGDRHTNDLGWASGNHHRWWNGAVQHLQSVSNDLAAYGSDPSDSHPTAAGNQKASGEFVTLLNVFYHRWRAGTTPTTPSLTLTAPTGGEHWPVGSQQQIRWTTTGSVPQVSLAFSTDGFATSQDIVASTANDGGHTWTTPLTPSTSARVRVASVLSPTTVYDTSADFTLYDPSTFTLTLDLPLVLKNYAAEPTLPGDLVGPADLVYRGAFRLPDDGERPLTFAYGGNAMTFNPNGDPSGPNDGFPGALFITGHDRMAYGELPDGSQVAEVNIPIPLVAGDPADLPQAAFIQGFHDVAAGLFTEMEELPRIGIAYLDTPATGPKIHLAWGQHFEPDPPVATHAWFDPNLAAPDVQGTWFIGSRSFYSVNGYLFAIPTAWADEYAQGRYLATGRFRDGGWSGMGPALFAYRPWIDAAGTPAPSGTHLPETVLLLYESSEYNPDIERCLEGYQHPDEWEGGAWITTSTGKTAVLFAGTKGTGAKYWYGFVNPAGPEYPCVEEELVGQFTLCRLADGGPCPAQDLTECAGHNDYRGWWSSRFDAQFILYDPADLARVAAGAMEPWEPQPYASLDIDDDLFLNPAGVEPEMLGTGVQRRSRIGAVAYDRANGLLYVLELFADEAKPVVHVWSAE